MRTEQESRPTVHSLPELDGEREIDFAGLGRTLLSRWWLVAAAVAAGVILGYLTSLGGGDVYVARTTLYLGQPLSPGGASQIPSLNTNPSTVSEIVRSDEVVARVAGAAGIPANELRRGISTQTVTATGSSPRLAQNPLVQISVRGPWGRRTGRAANLLAGAVVTEVSGYVDNKVRALRERRASQSRELGETERRVAALREAAEARNLPTAERLTLLSLLGLAEQRRGQLISEKTEVDQLITLANTVERSKQVTVARAVRVAAQSPQSAMMVGGFLGLLAGLALALLWDRIPGRRRL